MNMEVRNISHFRSIESSKKKNSKIEIIKLGINTILPPLGFNSSWFPLLEGISTNDFLFKKGIIFFNA